MLLELLASSPNCAPALISLLQEQVHHAQVNDARAYRMACALVANPAVSLPEATALGHRSPGVARSLFQRPDVDATTALDVLSTWEQVPVEVARSALAATDDPDGTLAGFILTARPDSLMLRSDVLGNEGAPMALRREAALHLASYARLTDADMFRIRDLVRHALHADPAFGRDLARQLTEAAKPRGRYAQVREHMDRQLALAMDPPVPGTRRWLDMPGTTASDVIAWAHGAKKVTAWTTATRDFDDPTGQVAQATLAAVPKARWPQDRVRRTGALPPHVRERAARNLHAAGHTQWMSARDALPLLRVASVDFVTWFCELGQAGGDALLTILSREDLDPVTLDLVCKQRARAMGHAARAGSDAAFLSDFQWYLAVALHPGADNDARTRAMERLERVPGEPRAWASQLRAAQELTRSGGNVSVASAVVNVADLAWPGAPGRRVPGWRRILDELVTQHAPAATSPEVAAVVLALAGQFTGTVPELFETATTIAG